MVETLNSMTVVGGQVLNLYCDKANSTLPKVIIPARDFIEGEIIEVKIGDNVVARHIYGANDHFPIHLPLDKTALVKTPVGAPMVYEIKHQDGSVSRSSSFQVTTVVFDSQSSFTQSSADSSTSQ